MRGLRLGLSLTGSAPAPAPELVSNGTFDTDATGWTASAHATLSVVSGKLRVTNSDGGGSCYAYQIITTVVGVQYRVVGNSFAGNTSLRQIRAGTSAGSSAFGSAVNADANFTFTATGTSTYITLLTNSPNNAGDYADFDNISVKAA